MRAKVAYWLALIYGSGLRLNVIKPIVQQWYLMEGRSVVDLFNLSVAELSLHFNIAEPEAKKILLAAKTHTRYMKQLDGWEKQGITVLPLSHPQYPTRLLNTLPPQRQPLLLWGKGNLDLLNKPMITVLGNGDADEMHLETMQTMVTELAKENIGVVSGYGKGLDRRAFETVLEMDEGQAIAILPLGITEFEKLTGKLSPHLTDGKTVLLSPFKPEAAYKEAFTAARNLLVDSLAMVLLVPEVDETIKLRAFAAMERGMPVLVGVTDTPENRELVAAGAFLMTDTDEVVELVQQAVIDDALQSQVAQKPAAAPLPPKKMLNETDDYTLHSEVADPLPPAETIEILSAGGNVPSSLREKLMALEEEARQNTASDGE